MKSKKRLVYEAESGMYFKMNVPAFMKEVTDNVLGVGNFGVLRVPMNVFQGYLAQIAGRCAELNDPVLNKLMCDMALYEESDRYSGQYNKDMVTSVMKNYIEHINSLNQ
jgi:hypothetical protein